MAHIIFLLFSEPGWTQSLELFFHADKLQKSFDVKIAESIFKTLALNHTVVNSRKHFNPNGLSVLYKLFWCLLLVSRLSICRVITQVSFQISKIQIKCYSFAFIFYSFVFLCCFMLFLLLTVSDTQSNQYKL